jgi:hypothetical protein
LIVRAGAPKAYKQGDARQLSGSLLFGSATRQTKPVVA